MDIIAILLTIGHIAGVAIGAGGATMSDILFLTSIRDDRIDDSELRLLRIASKVVVLGLLLLTVTGIGFLLNGSPTSARFWAKMTIVTFAAVNGAVMHRLVFPILERCAKEGTRVSSADFIKHAPLLVVAGPISAVSWYAAIILGIWRTLPFTYPQFMLIYGMIVMGAIALGALGVDLMIRNPDRVRRLLGGVGKAAPAAEPALNIVAHDTADASAVTPAAGD